ncbi:LutC/YkgG family protein [Solitalea koreensis]|uniref:L-lactate dehydrogenase complex protein LldG n=1 Tax=Solitalea koreensis TaxID=543615 RepID=A0A521BIL8_9SPHI|nr:LUD domain-containing protein [Solitalea koreensis]SMO46889.1 L-lactate dehydrogenase complex protein LldG [Solitalea koreensis]
MSAKEKIISAIKQNKPGAKELPVIPVFNAEENTIETFKQSVKTIGGEVIELASLAEIDVWLEKKFSTAENIVSAIVSSSVTISESSSTELLEKTDVAILQGEWGVAENGAIWLPEQNMLNRALPFITQHLMLVLNIENIVTNMHVAYENISSGAYGVFIAGPSKTADIEQSLVIGAHGARSLTVVLLKRAC